MCYVSEKLHISNENLKVVAILCLKYVKHVSIIVFKILYFLFISICNRFRISNEFLINFELT